MRVDSFLTSNWESFLKFSIYRVLIEQTLFLKGNVHIFKLKYQSRRKPKTVQEVKISIKKKHIKFYKYIQLKLHFLIRLQWQLFFSLTPYIFVSASVRKYWTSLISNCIYICKVVISVCLFVCPIITSDPLNSSMGQLLKRKFSFPKNIDQVRVNGGSNYGYPGQRWVRFLSYDRTNEQTVWQKNRDCKFIYID